MMCFTYVYVRMCYNIFWCYHKPPKKDNPFITQHCSLRAPGTKTWPWPSWQWKSDAAWPLWRSNETALFYGLLQKTTGLYSKNWFIMFILTSKCQNMGPFKKQCVGCSLLEWQHLKSWHPSWHHCPKKCVQTFFDQSLVFLGIFGSAMFRTCPRVRCFLKRDVGDAWKLHKMQTAQGGERGQRWFSEVQNEPAGLQQTCHVDMGEAPRVTLVIRGDEKRLQEVVLQRSCGARNMDIGMQIVSTGTARPGTMVWFKELI